MKDVAESSNVHHDAVRRKLFSAESGKIAKKMSSGKNIIEADVEEKSREWNFDFQNETPISGKRYAWEKVPEGKVPKFYHERDESGATSVSPKHRLKKECSIKSFSHKNTVVPVSKKKIGNMQNVQNENNPKMPKVFAKSTKILKSDSNRNRIVKATKNTLPPNQKLISQYFRQKISRTKVIDLTKSEVRAKEEPLCDYTNRTYFQTRSTASITTRSRRRKLSHEAPQVS